MFICVYVYIYIYKYRYNLKDDLGTQTLLSVLFIHTVDLVETQIFMSYCITPTVCFILIGTEGDVILCECLAYHSMLMLNIQYNTRMEVR